MCLTLQNAVAVLDHKEGRSPALGYTRTRHHIGHLGPGDCWFPGPDLLPHTVTEVHRHDGRVVLTDQYGGSYSHPCDCVISTAVPDRRIRTEYQRTRSGRPSPSSVAAGPTPSRPNDPAPSGRR